MRCRVHTFQRETHVNRLTKKKHYVVELFLIKILIKIRSNIHIQQNMFDNGRVSTFMYMREGRMNILNMIKLMFNVVFPFKYLQNISKRQNGSKDEEEAWICYVMLCIEDLIIHES